MTSEGLGEMFEGDSADMCAGKFMLMSMWGRAEGFVCADPGSRTPIGASGNYHFQSLYFHFLPLLSLPLQDHSLLSPQFLSTLQQRLSAFVRQVAYTQFAGKGMGMDKMNSLLQMVPCQVW